MKTDSSHQSDQPKPSGKEEIKVTLTFNSLDELLEHLSVEGETAESGQQKTEEKNNTDWGCGCYIALFIAIMTVGSILSILVAKIICM